MRPEQRDASYLWDMLEAARYGDVERSLIWDLIQRDIPVLIEQLEPLIPP